MAFSGAARADEQQMMFMAAAGAFPNPFHGVGQQRMALDEDGFQIIRRGPARCEYR
ncbi:hypothetical protein [Methylomonas sp. UP202]|uniref:hypothetical protein n=1 Tax=Methylomonas sp. UP202 TaxID=3040943 RepID=UPI0024788F0E|nr:hypothetical protein [Methylomonas sp. UP202]WGS88024.1 hypothetical protein QC632_09745 [Methylomonas sp. UP202]